MTTFKTVFARHDIKVPLDLQAEIEVEIKAGAQRQGDLFFVPRAEMTAGERELAKKVKPAGLSIVVGEATGNAHILSIEPDAEVLFLRKNAGTLTGVIQVDDGNPFWVIHTDEHGINGFAPGCYTVHGKREQRDEIERVAD
jgi:hypothetical protein